MALRPAGQGHAAPSPFLRFFLEVILVLGDDAFHPLACPTAILRARTPIGVLPELDASRWASECPRVFVDVLQLIGFVFVFLVHVHFIEEVAVHSKLIHFVRLPALFHNQG